ncbi:zona pellucida sperm-binding protein 3-like isoform X2 [Hoplias malabaricus]|uniref:zona pellucida sperm-binding protein 3-like isoform X2 n=1 Tax=Hoplias malabaricus TaxID=27720 RepID=UPI003461AE2B
MKMENLTMKMIAMMKMMIMMMMMPMPPSVVSGAPSVHVRCTEHAMVVSLRWESARAAQVWLGTCASGLERETEHVLEVPLHECGSTLRMEGDSFVYENVLLFLPVENPLGIVRFAGFRIPIQCRYQRTHLVSSSAQMEPKHQHAVPQFSLQLMTDNWFSERRSTEFHVGEVLNLRASVLSAEDTPLKLYVDNCVLTQETDTHTPRHTTLIHNHGTVDRLLELQINIRPLRDCHSTVYVSCLLRAVVVDEGESSVNKACTFTEHGWRSVDGNHAVCGCCDSVCEDDRGPGRGVKVSADGDSDRLAVVTLGPLMIPQ